MVYSTAAFEQYRWVQCRFLLRFLTAWYCAFISCYVFANTRLFCPLLQLSETIALSYTNAPFQNYNCNDISADAAWQWNMLGLLYVHTPIYIYRSVSMRAVISRHYPGLIQGSATPYRNGHTFQWTRIDVYFAANFRFLTFRFSTVKPTREWQLNYTKKL